MNNKIVLVSACLAFLVSMASFGAKAELTGDWHGVYNSDVSVRLSFNNVKAGLSGYLKYGEPWGCNLEVYLQAEEGVESSYSVKYPLIGANGPRCKSLNGASLKLTTNDDGLDMAVTTKKGDVQKVSLKSKQ